jgi:muconolactone delta-isomerase
MVLAGMHAHIPEERQQFMQFLVLSRKESDEFTDAAFGSLLESEAEHTRKVFSEGLIRQIWHLGATDGTYLLVEANDIESARITVAVLPLVRARMLEIITIVALQPYRNSCTGWSAESQECYSRSTRIKIKCVEVK